MAEKEALAEQVRDEIEGSSLEVDEMMKAQEQLKAVESEVATLQKSVAYWKEVRSALGGDTRQTSSLIDVVRTLYTKGKDVASKLFQRSFFDVAKTPKFMHELGLRGDKFTVKYGVIARHFGKDSSHTLTERDWEQLPEALQNPFAISKLTDKEDSYRIYTTLQTESGEFVVVGADVKTAGREIEVNAVSTVFGRRNNANLPKNEEVIYTSKEITPEQSSLLERPNFAQYPTEQELSSTDVSLSKDNVGLSDVQENGEESLPALAKNTRRGNNSAQMREKNRLSYPKEWSELTKAKKKYARYGNIMEILNMTEPWNGKEYAAEWLGHNKITPESLRKETGFKLDEQRSLIGLVAKEENGGISIEHAGELLAEDDPYNFFDGDDYNARNALLDVLHEVRTRGDLSRYIARNRIVEAERMYEQELEMEREYKNEITMRDYGMDVETYEKEWEEWNDYIEEGIPALAADYAKFESSAEYEKLFTIFAEITENNGRENKEDGGHGLSESQRRNISDESGRVRTSSEGLQGQGVQDGTRLAPQDGRGRGEERQGYGNEIEPRNIVEPSVSDRNAEAKGRARNVTSASYSITSAPYTTKKGKELDMYLVQSSSGELSSDDYKKAKALVRDMHGWYDKAAGGWMLRNAEDAKTFAEQVYKTSDKTLSQQIEVAEAEVNTEPTEAQKEAGNYKKGHVKIGSFDVTIEQPKGSVRSGVDKSGKKWEVTMQNTYGYIRGTEGVDGDHIDVFLADDMDGWDGKKVFVVDQYNPDGTFDEHKVMLGFNDIDEADAAYLSNYEDGWEKGRRIDIRPSDIGFFEKWINSSHRKTKAFSEYKNVQIKEEKEQSKANDGIIDEGS